MTKQWFIAVHLVLCTNILANESATLQLLERSTRQLPADSEIRDAQRTDGDALLTVKQVLRQPARRALWPSALYSLVVLTSRTPGPEREATAALLAAFSASREPVVCLELKEYADAEACALARTDSHNFEWTLQAMSRVMPRAMGVFLKEAKSPVEMVTDSLRLRVLDRNIEMEGRLEAIAVLMRDGSKAARAALRIIADDKGVEPMLRDQAESALSRLGRP